MPLFFSGIPFYLILKQTIAVFSVFDTTSNSYRDDAVLLLFLEIGYSARVTLKAVVINRFLNPCWTQVIFIRYISFYFRRADQITSVIALHLSSNKLTLKLFLSVEPEGSFPSEEKFDVMTLNYVSFVPARNSEFN